MKNIHRWYITANWTFPPHLEGRVGHVAGPTFSWRLRRSDGEDGEDAGLTSPDVVGGPAQQSPVVQLGARTVADAAALLPHTDLAGLQRGREVMREIVRPLAG